jgi:hypothetical protein
MIISHTCCQHLGPSNLNLVNIKTQKMAQKKSFSLKPFWNLFCILQKIYIIYYLVKLIIWKFPYIDVHIIIHEK